MKFNKAAYVKQYFATDPGYLAKKASGEIRRRNREAKRKERGIPEPTRPCPERCEACGGLPNGKGSLHSDHDHGTGLWRGWLCSKCNAGLGLLGDGIEGILAIVTYLVRTGNI